ncbi:PIN domain-containing protein [Leptothoe sp. PORK10 BA2]|uniref:PIN domain-containing protein n=1 Tax=Leptothoe sp. PORK10 BA2 TaxID=3110254 RepID=UPI002B2020C4|nr:DUF4411 family protein [Leptothoe sp. PORK10 BA2]MEA5463178.1 DUF4411 family protein [Leptothoe sp. PORK10 BA2]
MIYVFDTSSLIVLKNFYPDNFPSFWQAWDEMVENEIITSVREVKNELENRDSPDFIQQWVKEHKTMFEIPGPDALMFIAQIFAIKHFQALISQQARLRGTPVADPFVIAVAKAKSGTGVTEERLKPNAAKVPNVCKHFQIPCMNLAGFMAQQGWRF